MSFKGTLFRVGKGSYQHGNSLAMDLLQLRHNGP